MAQSTSYILIKSVLLISLISMSKPNPLTQQTNTTTTGFTFDLIHRDSPESPYYDPSLSPTQTAINAIRRSLDRIQRLNQSLELNVETRIERSVHGGEYLMRYHIGTRKVKAFGILDTGSDLLWLQCYPCQHCQKQSRPLYYRTRSSTYNVIGCPSNKCIQSNIIKCNAGRCEFKYSYLDGTHSSGAIADETLTLSATTGGSVPIPHIIFGCADKSNLKIYGYESGIVGLGRGPNSLASQLGKMGTLSTTVKFSYCLVSRLQDSRRSSKLHFGSNAEVSGWGTVKTPLVNMLFNTYYSVTLLGFSVSGAHHKIMNHNVYPPQEANMIVDSGTTWTTFPDHVFDSLSNRVIWYMYLQKIKTAKDPEGLFPTCFETNDDNETPSVTLHFRDADVTLKNEQIFFNQSRNPKVMCLAALPEGGGRPGLLGYYLQVNFLVGYEYNNEGLVPSGWIYFKPTTCTVY